MDRLSLDEVKREAYKPCPYFRTDAGPVLPVSRQRTALAQAVLDNARNKKRARSEREHRDNRAETA